VNVNLPDATLEFADVLRRALEHPPASSAALFATVDRLGVLDLLGAESGDPANAHLNTVVALEQVARAGQRAPIAETIWLRGHGLRSDDGFVAIASGAVAGADRLLPYGALARSMLTGSVGLASIVSIPVGSAPAHIEIDRDHLWIAGDVTAPSFVALDQSFAWRAAAASTVGSMTRASEMAIEHARSRVQFGKPLASFQALQFRMAECSWRLLGLRLLVREAAWRADRLDPRADAVSALAWLYAREVGRIVTKHAHQVHGAIGFTRELGLTTLTGASATLRALYPAGEAAAVVRAARGWDDPVPPSTILGGFQQ
jgi:hypothetical protein